MLNGDLDNKRAIIAGIKMMLVTNNAPTILMVASTAKDNIDKNKNSKIFTLIPRE